MSSQAGEACEQSVVNLWQDLVQMSEKIKQFATLLQNNTSELKTVRSRQAVSAGLQALSLAVMFIYDSMMN